jgi:hypothetical protein
MTIRKYQAQNYAALLTACEDGESKVRAEGHAEGFAEGELTKACEIAKEMLAEGADTKFIARVTKLSEEEITWLSEDQTTYIGVEILK